ncbi:hypothetical protein P4388_29510 [Bacillus thuringiensis]|nr:MULTISPECIES: binary toxin-like calcium binding domain-containing protein [Bacillus cereus group]MDA2615552.1 hypothetical protein [Bacillus cereus]MEB8554918.1 hypothetical protein [Bacillus cereus]MEB8725566.1 hypothetical protein [Bacillus cereus]MEB8821896.1 hypothetical protein [Bacillus cereus]MEB8971387.1 hypothetical protein [Bacillus cereus]
MSNPYKSHTEDDPYSDYEKVAGISQKEMHRKHKILLSQPFHQ